MDGYTAATRQAYERDWQRYEAATENMVPTEELDRFTGLLPAGRGPVLDAGCAFGRDTALLSERGLDPVGGDYTTAFIERARIRRPDIRFDWMDVRDTGWPPRSFTGVWCHATLHHLRDVDVAVALGEFHRILVPCGVLSASFKAGVHEETTIDRFSSDGARFFRYQTPENLATLLTAADFQIVDIVASNERQRYGPTHRELTWLHAYATAVPASAPTP